jgi:exopolyphosphatase/guanosine-5'-triphosphate,3'-diphosphate pyrophosphatase
MPPRILASADIGSNTVHLLVAEVDGDQVSRLGDTNEWISLGEIVGREGKIPDALADRLIKTLDTFRRQAASQGAEAIYVFGTEALRRASNQERVLKAVRVATGIKVDIISGPQEAELGLRGAWLDCEGPGPLVMVEVGGGSAQVALCTVDKKGQPKIEHEVSLPIGTGTLIAHHNLAAPVGDEVYAALQAEIEARFAELPSIDAVRMIACGGVARGLWRALHPDGEREMAAAELDYLVWSARRLPQAIIGDRFSVKPKRAATLLPGATVYRTLMRRYGFNEFTISRFGVREGAILGMAKGSIPGRAL